MTTVKYVNENIHYNPDFPSAEILIDSPKMRVVLFALDKGQSLGKHTSTSDVAFIGVSGKGTFVVGDEEVSGQEGVVAHCPGEVPHDGRADGEKFAFLAVISPRP